ncbi:MAG: endonuclease/exonuclease/phosphatase family protein [Polyangiaceae bacterium]|nr:endonuclease/exonuclease/phosphatase family protein [Polyangiaceae bacterium]
MLLRALLPSLLSLALVACGSSDDAPGRTPGVTTGAGGAAGAAGATGGAGDAGAGAGGGAGLGGRAGGAPVVPTRIATFNTENLFNDKIDGEPWVQGEADSTPTPAQYQTKLASVAKILALTKADVIALQEVENQAVLDALAARPELGKSFPTRVLVPGNDPRGIDVALLSIYPTVEVISHKDELFTGSTSMGETYKFSRDCLEVHLAVDGVRLALLVSHFKAKTSDNPAKRLAEAQRTRAIADGVMAKYPNAAVIILGDFNDFPGSPPVDALQGAAPALFSSSALTLPPGDAWTASYNGQARLHDDHRVNPLLDAARVPGSVVILHDAMLPKELAGTSDHAPVAATYEL